MAPNTIAFVQLLTLYQPIAFVQLLTLYQPMTHMCVMSSNKPIRMYMGGLILGVNTLYRLFCFFKSFLMVGKGFTPCMLQVNSLPNGMQFE